MYQKILVPLDGSEDSEQVLPVVQDVLTPGGEVLLIKIVQPIQTRIAAGHVMVGSDMEENEVVHAKSYLQAVIRRLDQSSDRWRAEAVIANTVVEGITGYAEREGIDLIAMRTKDKKGLAKLIKGSIAEQVQRKAPIDVRVFKPHELTQHAAKTGHPHIGTNVRKMILGDVDVFRGLSASQLETIASLALELHVPEGEALGAVEQKAENLLIVLEGEARLTAESASGEITVRIAGPGESFPLASLVGSGLSVTSGKALTDMEFLAIPCAELIELCQNNAEIGSVVYKNIAESFVARYRNTLANLTLSADRALEANIERTV